MVHTASPFPSTIPRNEDDVVKPAVEGTLAALRGCRQHKVKRLVITSSAIAIMTQKEENKKFEYTEEDWSDLSVCKPYDKSKTLAEREAWKFIKDLPEDEKFEIVTINPTLVIGPNIVKCDFTSSQVLRKLMGGKFPGMP